MHHHVVFYYLFGIYFSIFFENLPSTNFKVLPIKIKPHQRKIIYFSFQTMPDICLKPVLKWNINISLRPVHSTPACNKGIGLVTAHSKRIFLFLQSEMKCLEFYIPRLKFAAAGQPWHPCLFQGRSVLI